MRRPRSSETAPNTSSALSHTNRKGATYYLHEGRTKAGKPRYFMARTLREGALAALPGGYELSESINGVVSVRRVSAAVPRIPEIDQAMVRAELERHQRLRMHRVEAVKGELVIFEPLHGRYDPVMKFVPAEQPMDYAVYRMTYRGEGGWSWPLAIGPLRELVREYVRHVGTEELFELL